MDDFYELYRSLYKSSIVSLIAINIVILPIWIAIGTSDFYSKASFMLLALSLPLLSIEFFLCQLPYFFFKNRINKTIDFIALTVGICSALMGVTLAICHISLIIGIAFFTSSIFCFSLFLHFYGYFRHLLKSDMKQISEITKQNNVLDAQVVEINMKISELKKTQEEIENQPKPDKIQIEELEKQVVVIGERLLNIRESQLKNRDILKSITERYKITERRNHA